MKKGITLISIIIYLLLFTTFIVFAVSTSSNMNRNILIDKGLSIIELEYSKLYTNLFDSAKNSNYFNITENKIYFSNGDEYKFDKEKGIIYKNTGILCETLSDFKKLEVSSISNTTLEKYILSSSESLYINIELRKYDNTLNRDIIVTVGDDLFE